MSNLQDLIADSLAEEIKKEIDQGVMCKVLSNWPPHNEPGIPYGWAGEWTNANTIGFEEHFQFYLEIIEWLEQNVVNHKQNALWTKWNDCIYVQFRKEKDLAWFALKFGL